MVFFFTKQLLIAYSHAWSEPMFIFLFMCTFYLLWLYYEKESYYYLVFAGFLGGLCFLTRYIGLTVIITATMTFLLFDKSSPTLRLRDLLIFVIMTCMPMAIWLVRNIAIKGYTTDRVIAFHPVTFQDFAEFPANIGFIFMCLFLLLLPWFILKWTNPNPIYSAAISIFKNSLASLFIIFAIIYFSFVIFVKSFYDAAIVINFRILSPFYLSLLIVGIFLYNKVFHHVTIKPFIRRALCIAILFILPVTIFIAFVSTRDASKNGFGYLSKKWMEADLIRWIKFLPSDVVIYSNLPDGLYILTGRYTREIPIKINVYSKILNKDYYQKINRMEDNLKNKPTIIIWFNNLNRRQFSSPEELQEIMELSVLKRSDIGCVYVLSAKKELYQSFITSYKQ